MTENNVESMARVIASLRGINYDRLPEKGNFWSFFFYGFDASKSAYREKAELVIKIIDNQG